MKQIPIAFLLVLTTVGFAYGQSKTDKLVERELMQLQKEQDEAEGKKDIAALDRLLGDNFVFTAPGGEVTYKKQFLEDVKASESDKNTVNYDQVRSLIYGKTAVVNYMLVVKGRGSDGKDFINRFRSTVIWVKQVGRWRMAAIHVSRIRS